MPAGRPTEYTPEIGDYICERVSQRIAMAVICEEEGMPKPRTVYSWLRKYPEFMHNYVISKQDQADFLAEDALTVADDMTIDPQHKRIMVDTRKWAASKFDAKKYGDKIQTEHSGSVSLVQSLYDAVAGNTEDIPK